MLITPYYRFDEKDVLDLSMSFTVGIRREDGQTGPATGSAGVAILHGEAVPGQSPLKR
jgi:hypothetical protein